MATNPVNVEDFIADGGIAATGRMIIEIAKQVGVSTEFSAIEVEKEGLDTKKIIKTVNNLLSANKAINFYKKKI